MRSSSTTRNTIQNSNHTYLSTKKKRFTCVHVFFFLKYIDRDKPQTINQVISVNSMSWEGVKCWNLLSHPRTYHAPTFWSLSETMVFRTVSGSKWLVAGPWVRGHLVLLRQTSYIILNFIPIPILRPTQSHYWQEPPAGCWSFAELQPFLDFINVATQSGQFSPDPLIPVQIEPCRRVAMLAVKRALDIKWTLYIYIFNLCCFES